MKTRMKCVSFSALARDPCQREWVTGITNVVNRTAVKTYALTRDPGGRVTARNGESYAYNGCYGLYMCGYDVQGRLPFKDSPNGGDYLWDGWRMVKKQAWLESGSGECDCQKI